MLNSNFYNSVDALLGLQGSLERAASAKSVFGAYTRSTFPAINIFKDGDSFLLKAQMPGFQKEDIHIELKEDRLRISGEKRPDYAKEEVSLHRNERSFGKFDRTIKLPFRVDPDQVEAKYVDGILNLSLQEPESSKAKSISVQ